MFPLTHTYIFTCNNNKIITTKLFLYIKLEVHPLSDICRSHSRYLLVIWLFINQLTVQPVCTYLWIGCWEICYTVVVRNEWDFVYKVPNKYKMGFLVLTETSFMMSTVFFSSLKSLTLWNICKHGFKNCSSHDSRFLMLPIIYFYSMCP